MAKISPLDAALTRRTSTPGLDGSQTERRFQIQKTEKGRSVSLVDVDGRSMFSDPEKRKDEVRFDTKSTKKVKDVVHRHVHTHKHMHTHTHSLRIPGIGDEESSVEEEEDEELTASWIDHFPILTRDFYNTTSDKESGRRSATGKAEFARASDFFSEQKVLWFGYMSVVLKAVMQSARSTVCIKMIRKDCDAEKRKYVLAEQSVLDEFCDQSNFIIILYTSFQTKLHVYLVLEYVDGGSLERRLQTVGVYTEKVAVFYIAEVALAMFFLHQKGILHRDIRIGNVLLRGSGHICLIDFGLCKRNMKNKFTNTLLGSRREMAPEIHHHVPYNQAVDYWSIGIMLYTLLHGEVPFQGKTKVDVFKSVTSGKEVYGEHLGDSVTLCKALLRKNQRNRLGYEENSEERMKAHPFFADVVWSRMDNLKYSPPYVPRWGTRQAEFAWLSLAEQNTMFSREQGSKTSSTLDLSNYSAPTPRASTPKDDPALNTNASYLKRRASTIEGAEGGMIVLLPNKDGQATPTYVVFRGSEIFRPGHSPPRSPANSPASPSDERRNSGIKEDIVVYKLTAAKRPWRKRVAGFFTHCWHCCVNCCRLQAAKCYGVCCGLENVKAPVLVQYGGPDLTMVPASDTEVEKFYKRVGITSDSQESLKPTSTSQWPTLEDSSYFESSYS